MDEKKLEVLLANESDRIEWKESARAVATLLETTCALANDLGGSNQDGFVIIGVDRHGAAVGLDERGDSLDQVQRQIADRLTSNAIYPSPAFDAQVVRKDGKALVVVRISPYPVPPVVTVNGVAWVRKGSTTRRATEADLVRLRERRPESTRPFDTRPMPEATLHDLDLAILKATYDAERLADEDENTFPTFETWLSNRRQLGYLVGGTWRPTAAALLLYGKNPQGWLPGGYVDFVRYAGTDVSSPIVTRRSAGGTLPAQLEVIWAQLQAHLDDVPATQVGIREAFAPRFPAEALKELTRNLVQHRQYEGTNAPGRVEWYDDRIEFSNPGAPFGRASEGRFGEHSDYRNPSVTKELLELGYVQQLGRGVRRVRLLLERNGNPEIEVATDGFTRVTVRSRV